MFPVALQCVLVHVRVCDRESARVCVGCVHNELLLYRFVSSNASGAVVAPLCVHATHPLAGHDAFRSCRRTRVDRGSELYVGQL